jgi:hypothetical protein
MPVIKLPTLETKIQNMSSDMIDLEWRKCELKKVLQY